MPESAVPPSRNDLDRLDARIVELRAQAERAYQAYLAADAALRVAIADRDRLTLQVFAPAPAATPAPAAMGALAASASGEASPTGPEASTRTVQNVLFVLGGMLLGTAAIAFTVVAWATYGAPVRVAILATLTIVALVIPAAALARRLRATAETFAAIGLLLVALDGYAAWYVDLAGVRSWDSSRYAAMIAAITAGVALGYGRLTGLAGPAFVALVVAQPVALLVVAPVRPGLAATALLAASMAAIDALVVAGLRLARPGSARLTSGVAAGLRAVGWLGFGTWLTVAGVTALLAEATSATVTQRLAAGTATVVVWLVALLGAWVAGAPALRSVAAGAVVVAVVVAVFRTAIVLWPGHVALLFAATTLAVSTVVRAVVATLPAALRAGPRWAASGVALVGGALLAPAALAGAAITIDAAYPLWSAPLAATGPQPPLLTWELPVALSGLAAAALVIGPRVAYAPVAVGGAVPIVLALPSSLPLQWWTPPVLALGGAVVLVTAYLLRRRRGAPATRVSALYGAAVLTGDAVLTSAARPTLTALVLAAVVVLGLAVAAWLRRSGNAGTPDGAVARGVVADEPVGAIALATGLLALPPAVGGALRAAEVAPWWALRATVGAAALLLLAVAALRRRPSTMDTYVGAAFLAAAGSAVVWPLVAPAVGDEAPGIFSAVSLLLLAAAVSLLPTPAGWARAAAAAAAVPNAAVMAIAVIPAVLAVSAYPYAALGSVWAGRPSGVGLGASVRPVDAVALLILAVAGGCGAYAVRRRLRSAMTGLAVTGPTAVLAVIVAAGAPWPALPAATLAVGLALLLRVAVAAPAPGSPPSPARSIILGGQAGVYVGAGIAGALPERWTTLTALGVVIVAFSVVGAVGHTGAWRVFGCVAAVAVVTAEASVAGLAAELPLRVLAFIVLATGIAALFAGAWMRRGSTRRAEAVAIEAAANGVAAVALALAAGPRGVAAGVCAVWGLGLAIRALVPGITRGVGSAYACAGGGLEVVAWWLLLAERGVPVVEAYTLPLAAVALLAGWAALRVRPELRSWTAYGPALLAGLLPTLAIVLVTDAQALRRLALGTAALLCVVLGAARRRQAPVVVGGVVLALVALHELVLLWQRLPGWIPLALGGAVLLFLAITYERRRRDLARVRSVLQHMT